MKQAEGMVPDSIDLLRRAGEAVEEIVARIQPGQLTGPTGCSGWDVRDVISHLTVGNLRFAASVSGTPGPGPGEEEISGDPAAAFRSSQAALVGAFAGEGALQRTYPSPFGELPGPALALLRATELIVHAWDLAAATGQSRDLDADVVAAAEQLLRSRPIPRGEGTPFAPEQPVPPGATAADRLAAFAGRKVPGVQG